MKGKVEALMYCNSGELRRDLKNHDLSDNAIDYIVDSIALYEPLSKMITKIRKIIK